MKRNMLLLMTLLFITATPVNATVIDVVTVGLGNMGHAGTGTDPLAPGEIIEIAIVLNHNPYDPVGSTYPSYDGYIIDTVGLDLHVLNIDGGATLEVPGIYNMNSERIGDDLGHHSEFTVWSQSGASDGTPEGYEPLIVDNAIAKMSGEVPGGVIKSDEDGGGGPGVLIWNLFVHNGENYQPILVDLTLQDPNSRYANYSNMAGTGPYPAGSWQPLQEADLGDLMIYTSAVDPPDCWMWWRGQCHGDTVGDDRIIGLGDFLAFKSAFGYDYPEPDYNPCADYDRNMGIDLGDFLIFKDAFKAGNVPGDCPPGGSWPIPE
jgi:hypothetical protein